MWCTSCRQDVVGINAQEAGRFVCPRCQAELCDRMATMPLGQKPSSPAESVNCSQSSQTVQFSSVPEEALFDTWELDEELRHVARLLGLDPAGGAQARIDPAQSALSGWHRQQTRRLARGKRPSSRFKRRFGEALIATVTWLGVATLTCGACLLGWSEISSRPELQTMGLIIAVGGILLLAIGVTLRLGQPDSLARASAVHRRIDVDSPESLHPAHLRRSAKHGSSKAA